MRFADLVIARGGLIGRCQLCDRLEVLRLCRTSEELHSLCDECATGVGKSALRKLTGGVVVDYRGGRHADAFKELT